MNRDDSPDRRHSSYADGKLWYPIDARSKGTWLGVSDSGLVAALLNGSPAAKGVRSRGEIIPYVLKHRKIPDLSNYAPFTLVTHDVSEDSFAVGEWDGENYSTKRIGGTTILTSSRYGVQAQRKRAAEQFLDGRENNRESMEALLKSHEPARGIFSSCTHGPQSQTIASTIIAINGRCAEISDLAGSPCRQNYARARTVRFNGGRFSSSRARQGSRESF